jgi:hypothetical protein
MSDYIHNVTFNRNKILLEMRFDGDNYESATVKFELRNSDYSRPLEEPITIPVRCLFSMGFLILMSIQRTAAQYEKEAQEIMDWVEQKKHPFKDIGKEKKEIKDVKKD